MTQLYNRKFVFEMKIKLWYKKTGGELKYFFTISAFLLSKFFICILRISTNNTFANAKRNEKECSQWQVTKA